MHLKMMLKREETYDVAERPVEMESRDTQGEKGAVRGTVLVSFLGRGTERRILSSQVSS